MSHLISCHSISKSFGAQRLFEDISIHFSAGERLGLIGPNGAGKSTLLKIMADMEQPDYGEMIVKRGIRIAYLAQSEDLDTSHTVEQSLMDVFENNTPAESDQYARVRQMAGKCGFFDLTIKVSNLSGGWLKRLAIGRALITEPDMVLMDEPTNHLDMEGILWLEEILQNAAFAFALVSHDRYFLDTVTNRIVELSREYSDGYLRVEGGLQEFLRRKEELLISQNKLEEKLANKLRREVEWLARGPKARTTKARFRIDAAARLKDDFADVKGRNTQGRSIDISFEATKRKTKKLLTAQNVTHNYGGQQIFSGVNLQLTPGVCVGVLGNNGSGKSTLINTLAKKIKPVHGSIKYADGLKVVLFDQKREELNQEQSLRRTLAPDGDSIIYKGRSVHVVGWAKRFLFSVDQLDMPVSRLSGGEQARILIADLMRQQSDVLLLDEPTNDLDIPSLEVLEEGLAEFSGAIVLVSHDRMLLDRLADFVIGFDGRGGWGQFADYRQWLKDVHDKEKAAKSKKVASLKKSNTSPPKKKKMTLGEQLEFEGIEEKILTAEQELTERQTRMENLETECDPDYAAQVCQEFQEAQEQVDQLYNRWEELAQKAEEV